MLKKFRIEYHLGDTVLSKIMDFESHEDAENHVINECYDGFHRILDGKICMIPKDKVTYYAIYDNKEFLEMLDKRKRIFKSK